MIAGSYLRPYERRMTAERGKEITTGLDQEIHRLKWLNGMRHVYLAGGQTYQSVMLACIDRLKSLKVLPLDIVVEGTHGALGFQRAQLGAYLRSLPEARDVVGRHPNGTPIFRDAWGFTIDQEVSVSRSSHEKISAVVKELFYGPAGPTAAIVRNRESSSKFEVHEWVHVRHISNDQHSGRHI